MWETLGALLLGTAVSGVIPLVNAELLVVVAAAALPPFGAPLVALVSATGQMMSKTLLFGLARWAPSRLPKRARDGLQSASKGIEERGGAASSLVFTSAVTGLPPFYGVSLAAGALGMRMSSFVGCGYVGRFLRFGALAWAGSRFGPDALRVIADGSAMAFGAG